VLVIEDDSTCLYKFNIVVLDEEMLGYEAFLKIKVLDENEGMRSGCASSSASQSTIKVRSVSLQD